MEKTFTQKALSVLLGIVLFLSMSCIALYVYFSGPGQKYIPSAVSSTFVTTMTDPMTGEEVKPIEVNYYQNKNYNNGLEVIELRFNVYSDAYGQSIYSRGFQLTTDFDRVNDSMLKPKHDIRIPNTFTQYNTYDSDSFVTGHDYKWGDKMFVEIEDKMYAIALDGTYTTSYVKTNGWKIARTAVFLGLNLLVEGTQFRETIVETHQYTFEDLLIKLKQIVRSNSQGTGDSTISLIDLGNFLHLYEVVDGQISAEPIGSGSLINSYFTMDCHYDVRGMTSAKQSLFGSVRGDSQFNITGIIEDQDYWKDSTVITLDNNHFTTRLYEDKVYASINLDTVFSLAHYSDLEIRINLDATEIDGIDYYGLSGIDIAEMKISASAQKDFYLLNNSLQDTGLSVSDIITNNINLVDMEV